MSKNPQMFQIRVIWLSLYKAHGLRAWVAAYTSPAKCHARPIGDSPSRQQQTGLVPPRRPHPYLEETKSSRLRLYTSSHLKSKGNWGNNKGFINSIISNRKYWIGAHYNFFPYFHKYYVWLKKKENKIWCLCLSPWYLSWLQHMFLRKANQVQKWLDMA